MSKFEWTDISSHPTNQGVVPMWAVNDLKSGDMDVSMLVISWDHGATFTWSVDEYFPPDDFTSLVSGTAATVDEAKQAAEAAFATL